MKLSVNIARIIVGVLFIFSGLVKANDPLGLSYKTQEFFELWGMARFNSWTLTMSVLMNAFEIIAGVALLLGWRIKLFSWLLLLLILFFTFLTGYAYFSGKFKNCGCFGDCLPITPLTSFLKDIALLILIGFLFRKQKYISSIFSNKITTALMVVATAFSFGFQWYTLTYLPIRDCLPFKKGSSITQQMKVPEGARPDSFAIRFIYAKDGKEFEFSPTELPADLASYKFVSRKDKLISKGVDPAIRGFSLSTIDNIDSTQIILSQPYAVLLFCENFSVPVSKWKASFSEVVAAAKSKSVPVYLITTEPGKAPTEISGTSFANIQILKADYTAIRTAARTIPCVYVLKAGTIEGKWSRQNFNKATEVVKAIPAQ